MTAKDRILKKIIACTMFFLMAAIAIVAAGKRRPGRRGQASTSGGKMRSSMKSTRAASKTRTGMGRRPKWDHEAAGLSEKTGRRCNLVDPLLSSPQVDFGYDISDYENIDPQYGTMADFDRLVAEAGKRHIRVIMDMVMNHTSDQHKWFLQSRSSRSNPYRDWYVWHDGKGETSTDKGVPPNNWQSEFGHSSWQWDEKTRQYYYHKFYIQQPDLNWDNPAVHRAFKDIMDFWLKRGVAGFRFDAIGSLFEDPGLADEGVVKDKNGNPLIDAYGEQVLDGSKTFLVAKMHPVIRRCVPRQTRSTPAHSRRTSADCRNVLQQHCRPCEHLRPPGKPEFQLPMDTQVGFIDKLDVAAFRAKLTDAETGLGSHVHCCSSTITTIRGSICVMATACMTQIFSASSPPFCLPAAVLRCSITAMRLE